MNNRKDFIERIRGNVNVELYDIYRKLKIGSIKIEELSDIQKIKMIDFYKKQIAKKKYIIEQV